MAALVWVACDQDRPAAPRPPPRAQAQSPVVPDAASDDLATRRAQMVATQLEGRGIADSRVLAAMRMVPRHEFVPAEVAALAYQDHPLPIGRGQTISQPYVVAAMTELAQLGPTSKVLEIGTGSGYQTAVLAEIAADVYSVEIDRALASRAAETLDRLGYDQVHLRTGDGHAGWPDAAPFDAIVVAAAPPRVPEPLRAQLAVGGRLVIPVGEAAQVLLVIVRTGERSYREERVFPVAFVPMIGEAQGPPLL